MNHSSHILALLVALSVAGAAQAQATGGTPKQQEKTREAGPTYGPVLNPQAAPAAPSPAADASPQAQEERAAPAQQAHQRQDEPDPSARPAPQPPQPEPGQKAEQPKKKDPKAKPAPRRPGAQQRIEPTARIGAPSAHPYGRVADPATGSPAPTVPSSVQVGTCQGNVCTDANGSSYATGVGNAAVNSSGRLCNRNGTTMQCF